MKLPSAAANLCTFAVSHLFKELLFDFCDREKEEGVILQRHDIWRKILFFLLSASSSLSLLFLCVQHAHGFPYILPITTLTFVRGKNYYNTQPLHPLRMFSLLSRIMFLQSYSKWQSFSRLNLPIQLFVRNWIGARSMLFRDEGFLRLNEFNILMFYPKFFFRVIV